MSADDDVKELLQDIITKNKFTPPVDVEYQRGLEKGEGFSSKATGVVIKHANGSLDLFIKYAYDMDGVPEDQSVHIEKFYGNEAYFYNVIYPAYQDFLKERDAEPFDKIPKCYGTSSKHTIALENLTKRNFVSYDKTKTMDGEHLEEVLKIFAKFHAIGFSFKDRHREKYDELAAGTYDYFSEGGLDTGMDKVVELGAKEFLSKLDPVEDKHILDCGDIGKKMVDIMTGVSKTNDEYSIITQGDCWVNNMMFIYEDGNTDIPKDIILIDWQLARLASPVYDLSYFFYTIASKEAISNLKHYLKVYHEELSKQIRKLGSDPDKLYPFSVLEEQWNKYGKYGLSMAFFVLKAMLYSKDEVPNYDEVSLEVIQKNPELMFPAMKDSTKYVSRLKIIIEHLLENGYW